MTYDVILPAGGRVDPVLAAEAGTDVKALFRFGEETILARTVRVLRESGLAGRMVLPPGVPSWCCPSAGPLPTSLS
ncbi:hypothetical protein EON82_18635, partial [bacterium]